MTKPPSKPTKGQAVADAAASNGPWQVYILRCADGSLYTGIAKDLQRRLAQHNGDNRLGARYTRGRRPVTLVYRESAASRAEACRREHAIKRLSRAAKESLLAKGLA